MTAAEFQRLLRFYYDCIEEEDRHSLTRPIGARGNSLASPWGDGETLFHGLATEAQIQAPAQIDRHVLQGQPGVGLPERFFYGYPLHLDRQGFLAPLFFIEVTVEPRGATGFVVRPADTGGICLNHHLFRKRGTSPEQIYEIQEDLEGSDHGSFAHRLQAAFERLGEPIPQLPQAPLANYPQGQPTSAHWVNRPVIFRSEHSDYNRHLLRELKDLATLPGLDAALAGTALASLLGRPQQRAEAAFRLLQVTPLNQGQEQAAREALAAPLTVVTGPPGTGKSQVVVSLLASAALAGKPVLFASTNNKAVDVVRERLREILGEDKDLVLRLGNRQQAQTTRQEMAQRLQAAGNWQVPPAPAPQLIHQVEQEIAHLRQQSEELKTAFADASAKERDRRIAEAAVRPEWVEAWAAAQDAKAEPLDPVQLEALAARFDALAGNRRLSFWLRLCRALVPGMLFRRLHEALARAAAVAPVAVRADLQRVFAGSPRDARQLAEEARALVAAAHWRRMVSTAEAAMTSLTAFPPAEELAAKLSGQQTTLAELAQEELRGGWPRRVRQHAPLVVNRLNTYFNAADTAIQGNGNAAPQAVTQLSNAVRQLGADLPVWIVTSLSVRVALPLKRRMFDLVIIDEASQCGLPAVLPLLFRAKRALVIGDPHQLQQICTLKDAQEVSLASGREVGGFLPDWSYLHTSLYRRAEQAVAEAGSKALFLAEHYRSCPQIIGFSNQAIYAGRLVVRTKLEPLRERLGGSELGVFWHNVPGLLPTTSRSARNEAEIDAVLQLLERWVADGLWENSEATAGVVTPFALQARAIQDAISRRQWPDGVKQRLTVGTAHRFQGDECDAMIFSPVVAEGMRPHTVRWAAETEELLNVAITRARGALHVVGDLQACLSAGGKLAEFAASVQQDLGAAPELGGLNAAERKMAELLTDAGLWYLPQHEVLGGQARLDFWVLGPLGGSYDVEVDGRGHWTDENIREDRIRDAAVAAQNFKVIRFEARHVFDRPEKVLAVLRRLV